MHNAPRLALCPPPQAWQPCPHCHPGTPEVAPGAFFCESLPEAQEKCGAMAFAEMQDGWASADWMEGIKAGAVQWYNENLAENWRRLECAPLEGARLACQNKWSPTNWAVVFDADCGEAGTATLQVGGWGQFRRAGRQAPRGAPAPRHSSSLPTAPEGSASQNSPAPARLIPRRRTCLPTRTVPSIIGDLWTCCAARRRRSVSNANSFICPIIFHSFPQHFCQHFVLPLSSVTAIPEERRVSACKL